MRVFKLAGWLSTIGDEMAAPMGQTSARWQVLAAIENEPATVADIARALGLARQSVQRVADLIAHDGLAAYEDNPNHARAKLLRLTPSGSEVLAEIQDAQRVWADRLGAAIGDADLRRASAVLGRVIAALASDRHSLRR